MRNDKACLPHTETGDTEAYAVTSELKTVSFPAKCFVCQSDQLLESRFVGFGKRRESDVEIWSISLCESCRRQRHNTYLNDRVVESIWRVALCVISIIVGIAMLLSGPEKPPEGYVWTPHHIDFSPFGIAFGFFGALVFPLCTGLLVSTLIARVRFCHSQAVGSDIPDEIYTSVTKNCIKETCAKLGVPLPFGTYWEYEYEVIGAGKTQEATIIPKWNKSMGFWTKVFTTRYPNRTHLVEMACKEKLRVAPVFPYLMCLSSIILIIGGILDLSPRFPFLPYVGVFTGIMGFVAAMLIWFESPFSVFRKIFKKNIFNYSPVRRYWLVLFICILLMSLSVPAFMYGSKTHPYLTYYKYYVRNGSGLTFEYPREWNRHDTELWVGQGERKVRIIVTWDTELPHGIDECLTDIKARMEQSMAAKSISVVNRLNAISLADNQYVLTDVEKSDGERIIEVYLQDKDCWYVLRMFSRDGNTARERELLQMAQSMTIVAKP